jgi:hypothetical protein
MGELDPGHRALGAHEVGDALQLWDLLVAPQARAAMGDPAVGLHRRGLDEHDPGAADGELAVMHEVPVVGEAVLRRVQAHRRDHHAIARAHAPNLDRREQEGSVLDGVAHLFFGSPWLGSRPRGLASARPRP